MNAPERVWIACSTGLVEPARVIWGESFADMYAKKDGWEVFGPYILTDADEPGIVPHGRSGGAAAEPLKPTLRP